MRRTQFGTDQKSGFGVGIIIAIVAVILLLASCLCLLCGGGAIAFAVVSSDTGPTARSDGESRGFEGFNAPGEGEQDGAEAGSGSYSIGQDVVVGDIRWTILEAQDLGNTMPGIDELTAPRTTNGRFVRVRLEVENRSSEALTLTDIDLVDGQGRTFQNETGVYGYVPDQEVCFLEQLNPNLPRLCTFLFQIPPDANDLKASVGDLQLFGSEEALINLNLAGAAPQSSPPGGVAEGQPPAQQPPAEGQDPTAPAAPAEGLVEEAPPAAGPAVGQGQDVFIGEFRWRLLEVQDLGGMIESSENDLVPLEAQQGRLIQIRYEVEYTGSELATTRDIELIDDQGRRYEASLDGIWFVVDEEQCLAAGLEPGVPQTCTKIYDVPLDATGLKAEVFDLLSSEQGTALLDLGL